MDWDDVPVFLAVARQGSLRQAARDLGISQPTVGRRLRALEHVLGNPLFERLPDGHRLTAEGAALKPIAEAMEEQALALARRGAAADVRPGPVRISAASWPAAFLARHIGGAGKPLPAPEIELVVSSETANLARREADLAIRHGLPETGDLITAKIGAMACGLYGSADYVARHPAAATEDRYRLCDFVGFTDEYRHFITMRWLAERLGPRRAAFRAESTALQHEAIRAGAGLGFLPCYIGDADPALSRVLAPITELEADYWVIVHRDLRDAPGVRVVIDWATGLFREHGAALTGR